MLAMFPLATAKGRRWWSHWCSLEMESPDISTSLFVRPLKGAVDLPYTPVVSITIG